MNKTQEIILGNIKVCLRETSMKTILDDDEEYEVVLKAIDDKFCGIEGKQVEFKFRFEPDKQAKLAEGAYILQVIGEMQLDVKSSAVEEMLLATSYLNFNNKLCVFGMNKDCLYVRDEVFIREIYGAKAVTQIALDCFNILYQTFTQCYPLLNEISQGKTTFAKAAGEGLFD